MNSKRYDWIRTLVAGHDEDSNPILVAELVAAVEGLQHSLDASAERIRNQEQHIAELEAGLNHALARLNEQTAA